MKKPKPQPTQEHVNEAIETIRYIREVTALKPELSDYEHNLVVCLTSDYFPTKALGIVASAINYVRREKGFEVERKARAERGAASEFVGAVGGKVSTKATVMAVREIDGNYGVTFMYRFNADGNTLSWFASRNQRLEVGQVVELAGTVKKHEEYKGEKQTLLTRCTVKEVNIG